MTQKKYTIQYNLINLNK